MLNLLKKLISDEAAQDLAEYGIALAVIGVAVGAIALTVGTDVGSLWSAADSVIKKAL